MSSARNGNGTQTAVSGILSSTALLFTLMQPDFAAPRVQIVAPVPGRQVNRDDQCNREYQTVLKRQPAEIKRDPHCSLPGHYGRRLSR